GLAFDGGEASLQFGHDRPASLRRVERPLADLVARAAAAEAVTGLHVDRTDENAGGFHGSSAWVRRSRSAAQAASARAKSGAASASCCVAPIVSPVWPPMLPITTRLNGSTTPITSTRARTRAASGTCGSVRRMAARTPLASAKRTAPP